VLNVYCAFSQTAFSYRKIMFSNLSKSENLYLEFDTHCNFHFGKMRKKMLRLNFEVMLYFKSEQCVCVYQFQILTVVIQRV
jgi:hypothetical protein